MLAQRAAPIQQFDQTGCASLADFPADHGGGVAHGLELAECNVTRLVFHAAIRCRDQPIRRYVFEAVADAIRDHRGGFDLGIAEIDHAKQDFLGRQFDQHAELELGLRRLDRDLLRRGIGELGQAGLT